MKKIAVFALCVFLQIVFFSANVCGQSAEAKVYKVKIDGQISSPQLYILKRAIRAANADGAKILIVDMDTPGGDLDTTIKIMETLENFGGKTICYVNPNAISAGSFIAVACDEIYFSPKGVMGAAEAVNASGADIDKSMQRKLTSFLGAKVRSLNKENPRRAEVQRAMNDPEFELKIGGKVLKKKGELLTLTADEAAALYDGRPLLSNGTADGVADILKKKSANADAPSKLVEVKITWSETAAKYISAISPILMGLGFLLIFMDIKSGAFGILGGIGICALLTVFIGANLCGLAGHEEILFFILGVAFVCAEIFLFPGLIFPSLIGAVLIVGSLAWALGDIWPSRGFEYNFDGFVNGILSVFYGLAIATACIAALWKFLPQSALLKRLVLNPTSAAAKKDGGREIAKGAQGVALVALMPSGRIEVDGKILEATAEFGHIAAGEKIEIVGKKDFNFIVKKLN